MKMCESLARVSGLPVTMYAEKLSSVEIRDLFKDYKVAENFQLNLINRPRLKGREWIFAFKTLCRIIGRKSLVFGRRLYPCWFATVSGKKVVFEVHDLVDQDSWITRQLFNRMMRHKNVILIVAITENLRGILMDSYGVDPEKIVVLPDAASEVVKSNEQVDSQNTMGVGYVGHLYPGKGMEVILELAQLMPEVQFHIIGGRDEDIQKWKNRGRDRKNVTFFGHVPHKYVSDLMARFSIALAPLQKRVEVASGYDIANFTSPLKIFEYMAANKAIVASDIPVLREVLNDMENAILCPPDDIHCWKHAIELLLNDTDLRQRLSSRARKDFERNYTWDGRAKRILSEVGIVEFKQ